MPGLLTADEIAGMTEAQEENLPDVLNVISVEYLRDSRGEMSEEIVTGPDVPCRVKPVSQANSSAQEAVLLDRIGVIETWKIRLPKGSTAAVELRDRVFVDVSGSGGRMMEIVSAAGLKSHQTIDTLYAVEVRT